MAVGARTLGRARPGASFADAAAIDGLARLLLAAVALDLIVTRFVVRLAIFVPKGEPWASVGAGVGRVGAAIDALVPIVGLLLLGALLLRAGRWGDRLERAILLALVVVATSGLALITAPATQAVTVGTDVLVAAAAVGAGGRLLAASRLPLGARIGLAALAGGIALSALARVVGVIGSGTSAGLAANALGQLTFVAGAALIGIAGVAHLSRPEAAQRRLIIAGAASGVIVLVAAVGSPMTWGALAIWSTGLALVPAPLVAVAVGLAVTGFPALHRRAPAAAKGAAIVVLAGYGLAASGLVLAGLLGLVVARMSVPPGSNGRVGVGRSEAAAHEGLPMR